MRLISLVGVMLACLASAGAHLGCGEFACDACTALLQRQDSCAAQCAAAKLLETKCITLTGQLAVDCGCKGDDAVNAFNESCEARYAKLVGAGAPSSQPPPIFGAPPASSALSLNAPPSSAPPPTSAPPASVAEPAPSFAAGPTPLSTASNVPAPPASQSSSASLAQWSIMLVFPVSMSSSLLLLTSL